LLAAGYWAVTTDTDAHHVP